MRRWLWLHTFTQLSHHWLLWRLLSLRPLPSVPTHSHIFLFSFADFSSNSSWNVTKTVWRTRETLGIWDAFRYECQQWRDEQWVVDGLPQWLCNAFRLQGYINIPNGIFWNEFIDLIILVSSFNFSKVHSWEKIMQTSKYMSNNEIEREIEWIETWDELMWAKMVWSSQHCSQE